MFNSKEKINERGLIRDIKHSMKFEAPPSSSSSEPSASSAGPSVAVSADSSSSSAPAASQNSGTPSSNHWVGSIFSEIVGVVGNLSTYAPAIIAFYDVIVKKIGQLSEKKLSAEELERHQEMVSIYRKHISATSDLPVFWLLDKNKPQWSMSYVGLISSCQEFLNKIPNNHLNLNSVVQEYLHELLEQLRGMKDAQGKGFFEYILGIGGDNCEDACIIMILSEAVTWMCIALPSLSKINTNSFKMLNSRINYFEALLVRVLPVKDENKIREMVRDYLTLLICFLKDIKSQFNEKLDPDLVLVHQSKATHGYVQNVFDFIYLFLDSVEARRLNYYSFSNINGLDNRTKNFKETVLGELILKALDSFGIKNVRYELTNYVDLTTKVEFREILSNPDDKPWGLWKNIPKESQKEAMEKIVQLLSDLSDFIFVIQISGLMHEIIKQESLSWVSNNEIGKRVVSGYVFAYEHVRDKLLKTINEFFEPFCEMHVPKHSDYNNPFYAAITGAREVIGKINDFHRVQENEIEDLKLLCSYQPQAQDEMVDQIISQTYQNLVDVLVPAKQRQQKFGQKAEIKQEHTVVQSSTVLSKMEISNLQYQPSILVKKTDVQFFVLVNNFLKSKVSEQSQFSSFSKYMNGKKQIELQKVSFDSHILILIYERFIKNFIELHNSLDEQLKSHVKDGQIEDFRYGFKKVNAVITLLSVEPAYCASPIESKLVELALLQYVCEFLNKNITKSKDLDTLFQSLLLKTGSILKTDSENIHLALT